jgi:hypothetical protein
MNKHCYRIIFNKTRGLLMAVAETAPSQGKTRGATATPSSARACGWQRSSRSPSWSGAHWAG